ncbi:MAG: DegQ family serine endoprotease [Gammaproteobacteria bacterium]|nr:DegQ family serine endoprotease [Gammaproteobacteria bacterium]
MKRLLIAALLAAPLAGLVHTTPANAALPAAGNGDALPTLAPVIQQASPAVVNIATRGSVEVQRNPFFNDPFFRRFFDMPDQPRRRETQSLGSGVIVDADEGYIVTNHHVVENADEITITLNDNRNFTAEIIGSDERTDIAVLKIEAEDLTDLKLANSDRLQVGDFVVAIGNPFGLDHTVTSGIVSGLGRFGLNAQNFEDFIQTDASINPGNSGGALINLRGELVGINTAILSRTGGNIGIGFAIPVNMADAVMRQILEFGEVKRGLLGVNIQDVTQDLAEAFDIERNEGALVSNVAKDSAAEAAGIQQGDVIVSVNGKSIEGASDLRNTVGLMRVGDRVRLEIIRDGEKRNVTATIGDPDDRVVAVDNQHPALEGAEFAELDESSPLFGEVEGVVVANVERNSPAARAGGAGLRPGDVITSVNRRPVTNVSEFEALISGNRGVLLLNIRRGSGALFLAIR